MHLSMYFHEMDTFEKYILAVMRNVQLKLNLTENICMYHFSASAMVTRASSTAV